MGRYYSGDIEGKFWFGVQNSDAADRFGSTGFEPNYISYFFDKELLPKVEAELKVIENTIGLDNMKLIDSFFESVNGYNDKIMKEFHPDLLSIWNTHASDYTDYKLGKKIRDYLLEHNYCKFNAEL